MDMYIYYRVPSNQAQALRMRVMKMQAELTEEWGVVAAIKRRPEEKDGHQTWMEIYLAVEKDFGAILKRAVDAAELNSLISGERHTELFLDLSLCA